MFAYIIYVVYIICATCSQLAANIVHRRNNERHMHSVNAEIYNLHARVQKVYSSDSAGAAAAVRNASIRLKNLLRLAEVSYTYAYYALWLMMMGENRVSVIKCVCTRVFVCAVLCKYYH